MTRKRDEDRKRRQAKRKRKRKAKDKKTGRTTRDLGRQEPKAPQYSTDEKWIADAISADAVLDESLFKLIQAKSKEWPKVVLASFYLEFDWNDILNRDELQIPKHQINSPKVKGLKLLTEPLKVDNFIKWALRTQPPFKGVLNAWYVAFRTNKGRIWEIIALEGSRHVVKKSADPEEEKFELKLWDGWHRTESNKVELTLFDKYMPPMFWRRGHNGYGRNAYINANGFFGLINYKTKASMRFVQYNQLSLYQAGDIVQERQPFKKDYVHELDERYFPIVNWKEDGLIGKANCLRDPLGTLLFPLHFPSNWNSPNFKSIQAFRHWPEDEWDLLIKLIEYRDIADVKDILDQASDSDDLRKLINALKTNDSTDDDDEATTKDETKSRPKYALPWEGRGELFVRGPFLIYKIARADPMDPSKRCYGYLVGSIFYGFALRLFEKLGSDQGTTGALGFIKLLSHGSKRRDADNAAGTLKVITHTGNFHQIVEKNLSQCIGPSIPSSII